MKYARVLKSVILIVIVAGQASLASPQALAQSSGFTVSPLVKRGDRSPDRERFFTGDFPFANLWGLHAINNNGEVVFYTYLQKACASGLYLVSNGKTSRIPDPFCDPSSSGSIGSLLGANINNNAQVPINLFLSQVGFPYALFLYLDGKLERVVGTGDVTPMGTVFQGRSTLQFGAGLSDGPAINDKGEIAFYAQSQDSGGNDVNAIFVYSAGEIRKVVATGDSFARGGRFDVAPSLSETVRINDKGDVLFQGAVLPDIGDVPSYGFFLATQDGIKKIAATPDRLPNAGIFFGISGTGDLNNRGDVVFTAAFIRERDGILGIFLDSGSGISKIAATADSTPIGGTFGFSITNEIQRPRINNNGAIAFLASVKNGSASKAIFLASATASVKVAAVGDLLPTDQKIGDIFTFGLNDKGQVAFFAYGKVKDPRAINTNVLGLFIATPAVPKIKSVKLKRRSGALDLRITGKAMIANDTVIEINGVALNALDYPADFREDGGFTTRVISLDARLDQLIAAGQTVQVTVFNSLTNLRSAPFSFTR